MAKQVTVTSHTASNTLGALLAPVALLFTSIGRLIERALDALDSSAVIAIKVDDSGVFTLSSGLTPSYDWFTNMVGNGGAVRVTSSKPAGNTKSYEFVLAEGKGGGAAAVALNPDTGTEQTLKEFLNRMFDGKWDSDFDTLETGTLFADDVDKLVVIDQGSGDIFIAGLDNIADWEALAGFTAGTSAGVVAESGDKWE